MPKLPSYSAQIAEAPAQGGRRATAQDFGSPGLGETGLVEAGHRITNTATAYLNDLEEKEARTALVKSTEVRADYARRMDEAALSGADLGKLKDSMLNDLAKIGEGFETKRGSQQLQLYAANSEIMYDQQANAIAVQRAWSTARLDGQKLVNSASALIQSNPAYLAEAERNAEDFVATFPGIRTDQRAELTDRLKKDLNMAAAVSAARINPQDALKRLEAGAWNLSPEQRNTAIDKSRREISIGEADAARVAAQKKEERRERDEAARYKYANAIWSDDFSKNLKSLKRDILDDPNLTESSLTHLEHLIRTRTKDLTEGGTVRTNPAVFNRLRELVDLPTTDPRRPRDTQAIWSAYGNGLSKTDAADLEKRWRDNRSEDGRKWAQAESEFLKNMRGMLDKSTLLNIDTNGGARVQAFTQYLRDKVNEYRNANPPKDPYSLINPTSKDYIGKEIPRFQTAGQRLAAGVAGSMDAALGESEKRPSLDAIFGGAPKK